MADPLLPETEEALCEAVRWAAASQIALDVQGQGSRTSLGRALRPAQALSLSLWRGITLYEPEELVLRCRAGTPLAEVTAALAEHDQMLAFEPLLPGDDDDASAGGSVGGMVAAGLAGPRRLKAGGVRDHVLGVRAVSGFGTVFVSGGRVMKNVTGYDLPKLLTGSHGTLAVMSEITLKLAPRPQAMQTLLFAAPDLVAGAALMRAVAACPFEPSGIALLPPVLARGLGHDAHLVIVRLEGAMAALAERADGVAAAAGQGPVHSVPEDEARVLWRWLAGMDGPFSDQPDAALWRVMLPPAALPGWLAQQGASRYVCDWAGGLVTLALPAGVVPDCVDGGAVRLRPAAGDDPAAAAFSAIAPPVMALQQRIKAQFDPQGILSPGRLAEGL